MTIKQKAEPQNKGKFLEDRLEELVKYALKEWGFEPLRLRTQGSGTQFGKDNVSKWSGVVDGNKVEFEWCLEAKNYGTKNKKGQIKPQELWSKLAQIHNSSIPLSCWCIFSPFGVVDNGFLEVSEKAYKDKSHPFRIVLWTRDDQIERLIACFPELYKKIYKQKPSLSDGERKEILELWKSQVVKSTKEGLELRETAPTSFDPSVLNKLSGKVAKKVIKDIQKSLVEARIISPKPRTASVTSPSSHGVEKAEVNEEIDEALKYLNRGNLSEAKPRLFNILGKIEGKYSFEHELARTYNNIGVAYNQERNTDKAIDYFRKAIHSSQDFIIALTNLAAAHITKSEELTGDAAGAEVNKAEEILSPLWKRFGEQPNPRILQAYMRLIKAKNGLKGLISFIEQEAKTDTGELFKSDASLAFFIGHHYLADYQVDKALDYANASCNLDQDIETLALRGRVLLTKALKEDVSPVGFEDLAPKFTDTSRLKQAVGDFDKAMEIAIRNKEELWYSELTFLQKIGRLWLGEGDEIDTKDFQELDGKAAVVPGDQFVEAIKAFRLRDFDVSYKLLSALPEFSTLPYEEIQRLGRAYLYNGAPEIAKQLFDHIEKESVNRQDYRYWLDCSLVAVLLQDKNQAILAATRAKELAQGAERRRIAFSHHGAVMLRYADEEGGDRLLENALEFEKEFPDLKILTRFDFEKEKDQIIKIIKDRQTWAADIQEKYRNNPIPSYYLQQVFKKPYILVWAGRDPLLPLEYTISSQEFLEELEANASRGHVFVFDYLSLLTLSKLNLLQVINKIFPKAKIPFSLFLKIQEELLQQENVSLRKLWDFLRKGKTIEIVRNVPRRRFSGKKLKEIFEDWFIETLALAKQKNAVLVTDDFRVYRFVKSEKITPVNTWLVLQRCRKSGLLDNTMFSKAIGSLAECFYTFLSFNGEDLYRLVADDGYKLSARTYHLINQIFLPGSGLRSFTVVFVQFISRLWQAGILAEDKIYWLGYLTKIFDQVVEMAQINKLPAQPVLETASDFGAMWTFAIKYGRREDLQELQVKVPEMLEKPVFVKARENIQKKLEERLRELRES